jgi:hypothetical protein
MDLIARIEDVTLKMIEQISDGQAPRLSYSSKRSLQTAESSLQQEDAAGCSIDSGRDTMSLDRFSSDPAEEQSSDEEGAAGCSGKTSVDFAMKRSRDKFTLMAMIMAEAHHLLLTNTSKTRRSFYYELKNETTEHLAPDQRYVDRALNSVADLLGCASWDLSESK